MLVKEAHARGMKIMLICRLQPYWAGDSPHARCTKHGEAFSLQELVPYQRVPVSENLWNNATLLSYMLCSLRAICPSSIRLIQVKDHSLKVATYWIEERWYRCWRPTWPMNDHHLALAGVILEKSATVPTLAYDEFLCGDELSLSESISRIIWGHRDASFIWEINSQSIQATDSWGDVQPS